MKMRKILLLSVTALLPFGALAWVGYSKTFEVREYSAEIPAAAAAPSVMRIGVKLPRSAQIPKVEVFVDSKDYGAAIGKWASCNINSKKCQVDDARIVRFNRKKHEKWQELSVEIENSSGTQPRYAKLRVTFKDVAGQDNSGCGVAEVCGFAEPVTE
ncbi:MAG: hypothetical protein WBN65_08570 [Gammaproteobacteria bacterium]